MRRIIRGAGRRGGVVIVIDVLHRPHNPESAVHPSRFARVCTPPRFPVPWFGPSTMHNKRALNRRLCRVSGCTTSLATMARPPLGRGARNTWQTRKQCAARAALRRDFAHLGGARTLTNYHPRSPRRSPRLTLASFSRSSSFSFDLFRVSRLPVRFR